MMDISEEVRGFESQIKVDGNIEEEKNDDMSIDYVT